MRRSQPCKELEGKEVLRGRDVESKILPCLCCCILCTQHSVYPLMYTGHTGRCCAYKNTSLVVGLSRVGAVVKNPRGSLHAAAGEHAFSWTVTRLRAWPRVNSQGCEQMELVKLSFQTRPLFPTFSPNNALLPHWEQMSTSILTSCCLSGQS